eukprot:m.67854 g.67854  ORF g.67854 m.67854 type:complete len:341 (+) comp12178_c2_seq2:370-1392(+)
MSTTGSDENVVINGACAKTATSAEIGMAIALVILTVIIAIFGVFLRKLMRQLKEERQKREHVTEQARRMNIMRAVVPESEEPIVHGNGESRAAVIDDDGEAGEEPGAASSFKDKVLSLEDEPEAVQTLLPQSTRMYTESELAQTMDRPPTAETHVQYTMSDHDFVSDGASSYARTPRSPQAYARTPYVAPLLESGRMPSPLGAYPEQYHDGYAGNETDFYDSGMPNIAAASTYRPPTHSPVPSPTTGISAQHHQQQHQQQRYEPARDPYNGAQEHQAVDFMSDFDSVDGMSGSRSTSPHMSRIRLHAQTPPPRNQNPPAYDQSPVVTLSSDHDESEAVDV